MVTKQVMQVAVMDWSEGFEQYLVGMGLSSLTAAAYLADARVFCRFYEAANGQPFTPELLTSLDLREFRSWSLRTQGVKPATWNRRMASLETLCRWIMGSGYLTYNPFQGLERMDEEELAPRWLDGQEFKRFMREVEHQVQRARTGFGRRLAIRDQAMVALMVYAGLRESEAAALRVSDVTIKERSGSVVVRCGKGDKRRTVPLGREARRAVEMWLQERGIEDSEGALFVGKGGAAVTGRGIQKVVEGLGELSGVDVTPHQLRHTFAKRMLDQGQPLTVIQKLLGHSKLTTTARYVTPGITDLEHAVEDL